MWLNLSCNKSPEKYIEHWSPTGKKQRKKKRPQESKATRVIMEVLHMTHGKCVEVQRKTTLDTHTQSMEQQDCDFSRMEVGQPVII